MFSNWLYSNDFINESHSWGTNTIQDVPKPNYARSRTAGMQRKQI